ncbi:dipeptide epimerase [Enterococcus sp. LJL120]
MKIVQVQTKIIPIQLNAPFKTALREVQSVDVVRVLLHFDNGLVGIGEAAPTKVITGDTEESILQAINETFKPFLLQREVDEELSLLDDLQNLLSHNTSPKAAIDIALHDALAKAHQQPLFQFLGGSKPELETDFTISVGSREKMVADAKAKVASGFQSLKIKLGLDDVAEEVAKIRSINQALAGKIPFRIDANQGWSKEEAVAILNEWQDIPIDFVEQPVPAADFEGLKYVTEHTKIPIMADESLFGLADAERLITNQCCDLLNIKLMKSGGIKEGLKIYRLAAAHGIDCMVGSMIEGYAGMAAAAHFAASQPGIRFYDLDVPFMWETKNLDVQTSGMTISAGKLKLQATPGLGITD